MVKLFVYFQFANLISVILLLLKMARDFVDVHQLAELVLSGVGPNLSSRMRQVGGKKTC
jgi:hypothetical protein